MSLNTVDLFFLKGKVCVQDYRCYMYPHKNCDCCDHSTPVRTPPVKSEPIKFPEDTTCNLTMKVNLGDNPCLFILYYGRYYLMYRYKSEYSKLHLRHEILYGATLVFDETGKVYKNTKNSAQFIQKFVDENSVKNLLVRTHDLTDKSMSDSYIILREHKHSVTEYLGRVEQLNQFNQKVI